MLYHVFVAVGGITVLFGAWIALQAYVRRRTPGMGRGTDVLACRICGGDSHCWCSVRDGESPSAPDAEVTRAHGDEG